MIVKTKTGRGFLGCLLYVMHGDKKQTEGKRAYQVGGNMAGTTARMLSREFGQLRKLRPSLGKAVAHSSLSFSPDERRLSDDELADIASEFIDGMGFGRSAYVALRHEDRAHQHIHIVASRVDCDGNTVSDSQSYKRAEAVARRIEAAHGLKPVQKKEEAGMEKTPPIASNAMVIVDDEAFAEPAFTASAGEELSTAKARELRRRAATSDEYRARVAALLGPIFKSCSRTTYGLAITLTDGGRVMDKGDALTCYRMTDEAAAKVLIAIGMEKGWTSMAFSGTSAFIRLAFIEAMAAGVVVVPKNDEQKAILKTLTDAARNEQLAAMRASAGSPSAIMVEDAKALAAARPRTAKEEADAAAKELRAIHIEKLEEERSEKAKLAAATTSAFPARDIGKLTPNAWEKFKAKRDAARMMQDGERSSGPKGPR